MPKRKVNKISFDPGRLAHVLKQKRITRRQLLKKLSYSSESAYQKWKDTKKIPEDTLDRIAEELNVCWEYLRGWDLIHCTSKSPRQADAVQDPSGRYILPYREEHTEEVMLRIIKENLSVNEDFESWVNGLPLFESVNEELKEAGQDPATPEEIEHISKTLMFAYQSQLRDYLYRKIAYNVYVDRLTKRENLTEEQMQWLEDHDAFI